MRMLGRSFKPSVQKQFEAVFSDRECLEELGFSRLHKIVLGIVPGSVSQQLSVAESEINQCDNTGRTCVSWAAQRGDVTTVNLLLEYNADPNITTPTFMAPLHFAVEALSPACIEPLLAHGADPLAVDHDMHTALHFAVSYHDDGAYLLPIIQAGADLNAKTGYSYTPLITAVCKNRVRAVECLLDNGADVNLTGQYGQSPLQYAVEYNSHACLRLLIDRGADCTVLCEENGPTIIHIAVRHGDLQTVTMLLDAPLGTFADGDLEAESPEGLTIEEHVQKRMSEELIVGFPEAVTALIEKVTAPDQVGDDCPSLIVSCASQDVEDDDDLWEDALEDIGP
jgi:ankyrin repeat protein